MNKKFMIFHSEGPRMFPILLIIFGAALILNGLGLLNVNFSVIFGLLLLVWGISHFWKMR
ncbi:MAG: hypothetical protein A2Z11_04000 [Candidatus Woykebacteria bacterium RBG_16_43_9]|uniref:Uncharacterized protein n=1 Tax=Candidatus Woykebacteria bacterium RBG_16_43_9 TaxID=1802596 RepID=A0A1G1WC14_9BACT|nr:MAG: hypothetical protein A2Z11_04000 [Candidatus Woykebacteria bacterium RBG_16_43_9]